MFIQTVIQQAWIISFWFNIHIFKVNLRLEFYFTYYFFHYFIPSADALTVWRYGGIFKQVLVSEIQVRNEILIPFPGLYNTHVSQSKQ